jgi:putative transposase
MMKSLAQLYTQNLNRAFDRTGSLWEGRFRSCPVSSDPYALACYRYIELNPVRAGMVAHARDYRWSSYRANAEGKSDRLIEPHPAYPGIADYRGLFEGALEESFVDDIRKATSAGYIAGSVRNRRGRPKMGSVPI